MKKIVTLPLVLTFATGLLLSLETTGAQVQKYQSSSSPRAQFISPLQVQPSPSPQPRPNVPAPLSGGGQAAESAFRLIRSTSGSRVIQEGGRYAVADPRTVFYSPADKQVFVYFTVEGPIGPHHFEGVWKKPNGKVSLVSEFEYKAEQARFGGYFGMTTGDNPAPGMWTLELSIDGETVGSHSFQIIAAPPPETPTAPLRRVMSPSDIYKRAAAASVSVENISAKGERRSLASGFFIGPERIVTSFQAIDGANKVRIVMPDGAHFEAQDVLIWNRRQDWIILRAPANNVGTLASTAELSTVGDRVFVLDVPAEGNRVLIETSLIGKQTIADAGDRVTIGDNLSRRALGSPLLNEYGEVIGIIGGNLISTTAFVEDQVFAARSLTGPSRGTLVVPIGLVNSSTGNSPTTIDELARSGQFTPPLAGNEDVLSGTLSREVNRKVDPPQPIQERSEFSRQDAKAMLLITWLPKQKRKGMPSLRLYDLDNHLLSESQGKKKISVSAQRLSYSAWEVGLANFKPGVYRIDVALNQDTVWRTFFRIVD